MYELLRNKMLLYEALPPENGWEKLRKNLSDDELSLVAERLQACEATPPAGSWLAIEAGLEAAGRVNEHAAEEIPADIHASASPVVPLQRNFHKPLRRLAAAVILGLLLGGSYYFIQSIDQAEKRMADAPALPGHPEEIRKPSASGRSSSPASDPSYSSSAPNAAPSGHPQLAESRPASYRNRNAYYPQNEYRNNASQQLLAVTISERPLHSSPIEEAGEPEIPPVSILPGKIYGEDGELIRDMSILNPRNSKYLTITAPNGQRTRISAKLAFAMPYMGPSSTEPDISGSYYWEHIIREWQDKILQSGFVPSSANFLDILEFSDMILE